MDLGTSLDAFAAESGFSGVVRIDRGSSTVERAYGQAHRGLAVANTTNTRFAIASGGKGFTALAVASLIEDGTLALDTRARSILGGDLPLIDDGVTEGVRPPAAGERVRMALSDSSSLVEKTAATQAAFNWMDPGRCRTRAGESALRVRDVARGSRPQGRGP